MNRFYWEWSADKRRYEVRDRTRGSGSAPMAVCAAADDAEEIVRLLNYREQLKPLRDKLLRCIDNWKTSRFVRPLGASPVPGTQASRLTGRTASLLILDDVGEDAP